MLRFFFYLSWHNAVHFKRNVVTKTMSILAQKNGEANHELDLFKSVKRRLGRKSLRIFSQVLQWKICDHFKIATLEWVESQDNFTNSSHREERRVKFRAKKLWSEENVSLKTMLNFGKILWQKIYHFFKIARLCSHENLLNRHFIKQFKKKKNRQSS